MTTSKARPSDDQPFDFNLDAVKVEGELRPFRFHFGGKRWEMAHRETLDQIVLLEAMESGGEAAATLASLRAAMGDEQWDRFRKLGLKSSQLTRLSQEYDKFCGTEPGESGGSTGS
ncbi:hypothetical protein [Actinomadura sediminis]|uniref:Tail assembly chaperone n=1 Tax=Actinomadura sediminis TaxID=1038904 RepID=A0ABW3EPP6_9ACTN